MSTRTWFGASSTSAAETLKVCGFRPTGRETERPKGFGYVEFEDIEDIEGGKKAYEAANGQELDGRTIRLDYSQPDGGGRGGGRGGRGGFDGGFGGDRGGRGGGRGRGRCSDRRGRGGFDGRGGRRGDRERGDRGGGGSCGGARTGAIAPSAGKKITFD